MVTMSSSARPPAGLETKGAATMLAPTPTAPTPDTATVTPEGVVELIAAVTGVQDDVGDIIRPGAFRRTLAERRPKVCSNHRWDMPIGRVLDIKELLPGDPRLPRTSGDGRAWPWPGACPSWSAPLPPLTCESVLRAAHRSMSAHQRAGVSAALAAASYNREA